ncbi:MAG: hypothetical protein WBE14_10305 [Xanthobacteraceae bacterium]
MAVPRPKQGDFTMPIDAHARYIPQSLVAAVHCGLPSLPARLAAVTGSALAASLSSCGLLPNNWSILGAIFSGILNPAMEGCHEAEAVYRNSTRQLDAKFTAACTIQSSAMSDKGDSFSA